MTVMLILFDMLSIHFHEICTAQNSYYIFFWVVSYRMIVYLKVTWNPPVNAVCCKPTPKWLYHQKVAMFPQQHCCQISTFCLRLVTAVYLLTSLLHKVSTVMKLTQSVNQVIILNSRRSPGLASGLHHSGFQRNCALKPNIWIISTSQKSGLDQIGHLVFAAVVF